MAVLVTGAPGWLGTRLVERLTEAGREVRCLVLPSAQVACLEELDAQCIPGDLRDRATLSGACRGIDTVFHCAGVVHPRRVRDLYDVNFHGTANILAEATASGVARFLYVSSNSAAGLNVSRDQLMREADPPDPYLNYGRSKRQAEELVNRAHREGAVKTTIVRPCWFYGVRQPARQTTFFKMIQRGNPIVFGNGENLRSLSYVDSVVDGLLLCEQDDRACGETYWVADARPYRTIEIYETIARLLEVEDFRPRFVPSMASKTCAVLDAWMQRAGFYNKMIHVAGEMASDIACSIKKIRNELGYEPRVSLEEGMRRSIEWCRNEGLLGPGR